MILFSIIPPNFALFFSPLIPTLTALSTCRQRPVNAPSACRQHRRQRSFQEWVFISPHITHAIREDLGKRSPKIWHFSLVFRDLLKNQNKVLV
jgi:hypothetical protein